MLHLRQGINKSAVIDGVCQRMMMDQTSEVLCRGTLAEPHTFVSQFRISHLSSELGPIASHNNASRRGMQDLLAIDVAGKVREL